jgi:DNA-binding GntR family transcriptional regulator
MPPSVDMQEVPVPPAEFGETSDARLSLRDQAYDSIKRRIITMRYRPGAYLNEARISDDLSIGRTPVRQALERLRLEGMVDIMPRKGVIVRPVSLEEVLELIEIRLVNEPYCAALAAQRVTSLEITALQSVLVCTDQHIATHDLETLMDLDREFHGGISRAARNRVLGELLLQLHERSLRFWFITLNDRHHLLQVRREHGNILQAIAVRDAEAVCTENLVRFDCVTESLNVGCDGRAAVLPFKTIGLAVQVTLSARGGECSPQASADRIAAQGTRSRPFHEQRSPVLHSSVSLVSIGPQGHDDHAARDACALATRWVSPLLALEIPLHGRSASNSCGITGTDLADER